MVLFTTFVFYIFNFNNSAIVFEFLPFSLHLHHQRFKRQIYFSSTTIKLYPVDNVVKYCQSRDEKYKFKSAMRKLEIGHN